MSLLSCWYLQSPFLTQAITLVLVPDNQIMMSYSFIYAEILKHKVSKCYAHFTDGQIKGEKRILRALGPYNKTMANFSWLPLSDSSSYFKITNSLSSEKLLLPDKEEKGSHFL